MTGFIGQSSAYEDAVDDEVANSPFQKKIKAENAKRGKAQQLIDAVRADQSDKFRMSSTTYVSARSSLAQYNYKHNLHLVPKPSDVATVLRNGIWTHACLDAYHKKGDYMEVLDALCAWAIEHDISDEKIEEHRKKAETIMLGYTGFWRNDDKWKVIATEEHLEAEIGGVVLTCTLDMRIMHPQYGHMIVEHKSTGEIPSPAWRTVDPQTAIQLWIGGKQNFPEGPLNGVLFNYLLTKEPAVPQVKKDGEFYANAYDRTTTTAAFERAVQKVLDLRGDGGDYIEKARAVMVNDARFYQRFPIIKPDAVIRSTLRDVAMTVGQIKVCERLGVWPCRHSMLEMKRFCSYGRLCVQETALGKPSHLREDEYVIDTGEREADEAVAKYLTPFDLEGEDE